jgi:hypothetical protein
VKASLFRGIGLRVEPLATPLQCGKIICGYLADAFQPLFLSTIFFFVNPAQKLLSFQTLNVLLHKAIEFMAKLFDVTHTHTARSLLAVSE